MGKFVGKELQRDVATEFQVFRLVRPGPCPRPRSCGGCGSGKSSAPRVGRVWTLGSHVRGGMRERSMEAVQLVRLKGWLAKRLGTVISPTNRWSSTKAALRWKVLLAKLSNRQVEGAACPTAGTAQIARVAARSIDCHAGCSGSGDQGGSDGDL